MSTSTTSILNRYYHTINITPSRSCTLIPYDACPYRLRVSISSINLHGHTPPSSITQHLRAGNVGVEVIDECILLGVSHFSPPRISRTFTTAKADTQYHVKGTITLHDQRTRGVQIA